jgi:hypothetical protein
MFAWQVLFAFDVGSFVLIFKGEITKVCCSGIPIYLKSSEEIPSVY